MRRARGWLAAGNSSGYAPHGYQGTSSSVPGIDSALPSKSEQPSRVRPYRRNRRPSRFRRKWPRHCPTKLGSATVFLLDPSAHKKGEQLQEDPLERIGRSVAAAVVSASQDGGADVVAKDVETRDRKTSIAFLLRSIFSPLCSNPAATTVRLGRRCF